MVLISRGTQSGEPQTRNYSTVYVGRRAQCLPYTLTAQCPTPTPPSIHLSFSSAQSSLKFCYHEDHRQSPRSTPTSPIDSKSSSLGTLEVRDRATFSFHSCLEPKSTSSRLITLLPTPRLSLVPVRPTSTTGFVVQLAEYALTAAISSTGMAAYVTSEISTSRGIARRALV